ncbi:MAG: acyl-CoA dehydrogenase [Actinobacteria bacterium]|nr:acyl-CoA dehydrogenase [Actinomycetota bacterium]
MNFDLSEEQQVIKDLALQIFAGQATVERVKAVEKGDGFDRDLWDQLASSGIQALCVPEEFGGSGFGAVELSLALMGQGRHVAPVPLWTSGVAALALADFGSSSQQSALLPGIATGATVVAIALAEQGANDVMRPTVVREALRSLYEHSLAALAAIQVGVAEGSLALTATHLSGRTQFGKPLSAFQATTQRAADGYITTEAMRVTALNAAWRLSEGFDARRDVAVAAYWASEGAQQVVTAAQHLHGGIGADIDYPVHRYFLWGIQLASVLGSASSHLSRLGNLIART